MVKITNQTTKEINILIIRFYKLGFSYSIIQHLSLFFITFATFYMRGYLFIIYLIGFVFISFSQTKTTKKQVAYFRSIEYFNTEDSSKDYAVVYRPNQAPKALLILLPGFGESPQLAERETNIPEYAATAGILTLIISNTDGNTSFYIDQKAQQYLDEMIPEWLIKYNITSGKYYLGGFSLGGSGVVKYVQHCQIYDIPQKPTAVFAIDPPLDFYRMYKVYDKWLNDTSISYLSKKQYQVFMDKMKVYFKGSVSDAYDNYMRLSPYSYEDKDNIGARLFGNTPIQIYSEPDFNWTLNEKHWDIYDLNIIDCESFINHLQKNGNKNASLVITLNKGKRKLLNIRHPHSWSIADGNEVIKWLNRF